MGLREFRSLGRLRELQLPELISLSVRRHGVLLTFLAGVLAAGLPAATIIPARFAEKEYGCSPNDYDGELCYVASP